MSTVPSELPVKPSETAALADLIFQFADGRPLNDEIRNRIHSRLAGLEQTSIVPFLGSLQKDPIHSSAYYVAIDAVSEAGVNPLLLRMALASSPGSAHFPESVLVGRMRPGGGREIVVNAIPFAASDQQNIRAFANHIDRSFYPRPQGAQSALSVAIHRPDPAIPAAFDAFRAILRKYGANWASLTAAPGAPVEDVYFTALWAAIRAGWREGYNLGIAVSEEGEVPVAAGYTRFSVPLSAERLFDSIRETKSPHISSKYFDFEVALNAEDDIASRLESLHANGHVPQMIAPAASQYENAEALAEAARHFNATLSFSFGANPDARDLRHIAHSTGGRFNVTVDQGTGTREQIAGRIVSLAGELRT